MINNETAIILACNFIKQQLDIQLNADEMKRELSHTGGEDNV